MRGFIYENQPLEYSSTYEEIEDRLRFVRGSLKNEWLAKLALKRLNA